jgi:hypothetical protein
MLKNAKEMRKNYIERVKEVADDIVNVIDCLESENCWEAEMGDDYTVDVLFLIEGSPEYEPGVDVTEVYDYLSVLVDSRISMTKPVIEALTEIFEINCDPWTFELILKGYEADED